MVDKNISAVAARRQARERLAQERAEQAERNRRNEEDLIDFLMSEQKITAADSERDTAIKTAQERHRTVVEKLKQRQAACLTRMSDRGESSAVIADRTGLTVREVKHRLVRSVDDAQPDDASLGAATGRRGRPSRTNGRTERQVANGNSEGSVQETAVAAVENGRPS